MQAVFHFSALIEWMLWIIEWTIGLECPVNRGGGIFLFFFWGGGGGWGEGRSRGRGRATCMHPFIYHQWEGGDRGC